MNALLKIAILIGILGAFSILVSVIVPQPFTTGIDNAIVYFLSSLAVFSFLFDVNVLFICIRILAGFLTAIVAFIIGYWMVHFLAQ